MADIQADIPAQPDQCFDLLAVLLVVLFRQQDQNVDVGAGEQVATAITSYCDQGYRIGKLQLLPHAGEYFVDHVRGFQQQRLNLVILLILLTQLGAALFQVFAPVGCVAVDGHGVRKAWLVYRRRQSVPRNRLRSPESCVPTVPTGSGPW